MGPDQLHEDSRVKQKNNYKKAISCAAVFVIIAVLALAGWKWYGQIQEYSMNVHDRDKQIGQLEKEVAQLKKQAANNQYSNSSDTLVIEEWGVKVDVQQQGMRYIMANNSGSKPAAWFTTDAAQGLFKKYGACGNYEGGLNHFYLGVLSQEDTKQDEYTGNTFLKEINGKYYYYTLGNGQCSVGSDMEIEAAARAHIKAALLTLREK